MKKLGRYLLAMTTNNIVKRLIIVCLVMVSMVSWVQARQCFYFLVGETVECYSMDGVFQESFQLKSYPEPHEGYMSFTTDGYTAWTSHNAEYDFVTAEALRSGGTDTVFPINSTEWGYCGGIAINGNTTYLGRYKHYLDTDPFRIELYSGGSFSDQWYLSNFIPDHMQYVNGWIVIASGNSSKVRIYDTSGNLEREFSVELYPGHDITVLSADDSYIYLQYYSIGANKAHAFDWHGNRQEAHDVDFPGLATPAGAAIAWGPDIPIIMPNPAAVDFGPVASGGQCNEALTISNVGVENLLVTAVSLGDTSNFTCSGISLPLTLLPGESQQLSVSFTPQVSGDLSTTLTISSTCGSNPELAIPLSGRSLAAVFYVDAGATGTGDGSSWSNAFPSIGTALASGDVLDGASLWVREGIYNLTGTIQANKAVEIYGGFPEALYNPGWSNRDWENAPSIIQGNNSFTCVEISANATIDGFTITAGSGSSLAGGGIYVSATKDGPEVHAVIDNCTVTGNSSGYGGGINVYAHVDSCSISNCVLSNNTAVIGGGMYLYGDGIVVTDCLVTGNTAERTGGGILTERLVSMETAPVIKRCEIINNEAGQGGGIYNNSRNTTITNCLITDNSITGGPGGSGIESYNCSTPITNCTIVNNHGSGGGFVNTYAVTPAPVLKNCILWGNDDEQIFSQLGASVTVVHSDVDQDGYGAGGATPDGNGNLRYNPLFIDAAGGDFRLRLGSVCIDTGTDVGAPLDDLYGIERPQGDSCDMGACEYDGIVYNGPWYVDNEVLSSGDGRSWGTAFKSIAEAFTVAGVGEEVLVKNGTYLLNETIEIDKAVTISGSFTGIGTERSPWQDGSTIINGQELGNCFHITANGTLDGFLITGGRDVATYGGAICNEIASPHISHCIFRDNLANNNGMGGAIFSSNYSNDPLLNGTTPHAVISECIFEANYGQLNGSAFAGSYDASSFSNCLFVGNSGGLNSEVVRLDACTTTFTNCTFSNNRNGTAIYMFDCSAEIKNSIFWENGDELHTAYGTPPIVTYCNIQGGYAGGGNIDLDPGFVAPGHWDDNGTSGDLTDDFWISGNYHLGSNSGCIDMGTSAGAPDVDLDGVSRPQDLEVDMGAYEYIALLPVPLVDFNSDNSHDIALFYPDSSKWYIKDQSTPTYGTTDCIPIPGDYDGDGATDLAVVDLTRSDGMAKWYLDGSGVFIYGLQEWIPVPGDYDGDGVSDAAFFNPDTGKWYVRNQFITTYGAGGIPVPGDYDGNGTTDIAVFNPTNNKWYIKDIGIFTYGMADCIPVPADYDGDNATDLAVIDTSRPDGMAKWYIRNQAVFIYGAVDNTIPVPGDYDGDGDADPCIFYQDSGKWYCRNLGVLTYGNGSMIPLASNLATRYAISQAAGGNTVW